MRPSQRGLKPQGILASLWLRWKQVELFRIMVKGGVLLISELLPPLGRFFYNLGISPQGLNLGTGEMATDWNARARSGARWYIYWDAWRTEDEFDAAGEQDVRDVVLKGIRLTEEAKSLEIGCGVGRLLKHVSKQVAEAYGVDISEEMVRQGKERLKDCANIFISTSDGTLVTFVDNSFDMCYSIAVFRHIPKKEYVYTYFSETSRVLKPGGIFRFEVWNAGPFWARSKGGTVIGVSFKEFEIRSKLEEHGFEFLASEKRPKLPYTIYSAVRKPKPGVEATRAVAWLRGAQEDMK